MVTIKGNSIAMTRGDTLRTVITIKDGSGNDYAFAEGDKLAFYLGASANGSPLVSKEIPTAGTAKGELHLTPDDTKALKLNRYVYDIELTKANGDIDTIINAAPFELFGEVG